MEHLRQEGLAHMLANTLNDPGALSLYKTYVQRYPHGFLRDTLAKVMAIPQEKIRSNRAALFVYLVQQYDPRYHGN